VITVEEVFVMPVLEIRDTRGTAVPVDAEGYLEHFDDWNDAVARELARREGVGPLSDDKLASLRFIREHYRKFNFFPIVRAVCRNVHKPKDCVQEDFLNPLIAWKLAGLPHPGEPIISLLEAGQSPG
jgi:TusE/DsrC/DsvC family sulfur relay protein